ncbi:MAG: hypothetical protein E7555_07475 [Ruminococcaceae bacterium]|nr:hypothetical protein [Oscillospiraceae bacterium]
MEDILELFVEVYMGVMTHFVPDKKVRKVYLKVIAGIWAAIFLVTGLVAIVMLAETNGESTAGKVMLIAGFVVTTVQIVVGFIIVKRKNK